MIKEEQLIEYSKETEFNQEINEKFEEIRKMLTEYRNSNFENLKTYLQGSSKNKTNIKNKSDIDILIRCDRYFESNLNNEADNKLILKKIDFNYSQNEKINHLINTKKEYTTFKNSLFKYLKDNKNFKVKVGSKTIKCRIKKANFKFDIVCAFGYRFYYSKREYIDGNYLQNKRNKKIISFGKYTYINQEIKNKRTNENYKKIIRVFKNISKRHLKKSNRLSSFEIESLLYNVNDEIYLTNNNFKECCIKIINELKDLLDNSWNNLVEPNELRAFKDIENISKKKVKKFIMKIQRKLTIN